MKLSWKNLFNWTVLSVSEPVAEYIKYGDIGMRHMGYNVRVVYNHHGEFRAFFGIDEDKLGFCTQQQALKKAQRYYNKMSARIHKKMIQKTNLQKV